MNRGVAVIVALLMVTSAVGMAFAASAGTSTEPSTDTDGEQTTTDGTTTATADGEAYAGAHVAFEVEGDAIADYRIDGDEAFSSVAVQSQSETEADAGVGAEIDLETMTSLEGAGLSMAAQSETNAQIEAESGATLSVHDTDRATLVVESGDEGQYVQAELAADATAEADGDRVRVETDDHEGTFLVVGDGEVAVNSEGDVTAELAAEATLVFRSYDDGERDETDEYEESLIADGESAVEVHVEERDGEAVGDAVTYGQETSAEATTEARNRVDVTIDRAIHEGTVVLTTVSEEAVGSLEDLEVRVDGEAAVEASSYSELEGAVGSDESRYKVANHAEASAEATVYIAVNHFSERTATVEGDETDDDDDADDSDGTDDADDSDEADDTDETDTSDADDTDESDDADSDDTDETTDADDGDETNTGDDSVPGFGVGAALIATLAAITARVHR